MKKTLMSFFVGAIFLLSATPQPVRAIDPVTTYCLIFLGEHILGEGLNELYDRVTGKPDIREIDRRLKMLEENGALRSEMQAEIRKLRTSINDKVSKAEFLEKINELKDSLGDIYRRIIALEKRVELQEVQIEDLTNKTLNSTKASYFLARGDKFAAKKDTHRALANYALAIEKDEKLVEAYVQRAKVFQAMKADEVAMYDYSKALAIDPDLYEARYERGIYYAKTSKFKNAIEDLNVVLKTDPVSSRPLFYRGLSYLAINQNDMAIADFQARLKVVPNDAPSYNNIGVAIQNKENHPLALQYFTKALDNEKKGIYFANRSKSYYHTGEYQKSAADCEKAISMNAVSVAALEAGGQSYFWLKQYDKAIPLLTKAIEGGARKRELYEKRGECYYIKEQARDCINDMTTAINMGSDAWWVYRDRGVSYFDLKDNTAAIRDLTTVINKKPENKALASAYWIRGIANSRNGNRPAYREDLRKALELNADYQKDLKFGDVLVVNNTKQTIVIDVDFWVYSNGEKETFTLPYEYTIAPGKSTYLLYKDNYITATKFQAYVKTDNGKKLYYWNYKKGVDLEVEVNTGDLP
ncbi:MAG: tetratricopeptide repeat protein [Zavarzinella sp.]